MTGLAAVQDPSDATMSIVDKLFGVKLRTSLRCEESGEVIEVRLPHSTSELMVVKQDT